MKRKLMKKGKVYVITFDDEGIIDTVECGGEFLSTKNAVVKSILVHEDAIRYGNIPKGFEKVRG
jgi:hypothetical protein